MLRNHRSGCIAHPLRWAASLSIATGLLAMGCASLDPVPVEEARTAVQSARTDANVVPGSLDLEQAARHLGLAEEALKQGRYQSKVDHEAFMATRYAQVARVRGEARLAQDETSAYLSRAVADTAGTRAQVEAAVRRARALNAEQTERGLVLTLGGVQFEFDSAELKPEAERSVARVAGFLIAAENREVLIEGFSDDVGEQDYNRELSKRRAESVATALVANGITPRRIAAGGFGDAYPVAPNDTDEGRALNRRVEIIILDAGVTSSQARRGGGLPGVAAGPE